VSVCLPHRPYPEGCLLTAATWWYLKFNFFGHLCDKDLEDGEGACEIFWVLWGWKQCGGSVAFQIKLINILNNLSQLNSPLWAFSQNFRRFWDMLDLVDVLDSSGNENNNMPSLQSITDSLDDGVYLYVNYLAFPSIWELIKWHGTI